MTAAMEDNRQEKLRTRLFELGFDAVRFAALRAAPAGGTGSNRDLQRWLADGMQADMDWMERSLPKRLDPQQVVAGARSVIMLGVNYWDDRRTGESRGARPRWARYALYEDYHDTIKPALVQAGRCLEEIYGVNGTDYRYYVDTGPVIERGWAAHAGLGFIGKNAMLISRQYGNWVFLAAVLTRLDLVEDPPVWGGGSRERDEKTARAAIRPAMAPPTDPSSPREKAAADGVVPTAGLLCGKCTLCLDSCPTHAFAAPGVVDARRCISYQTIENKGIIPRELRPWIGNRIYGCDVCLEVCPWNRFARAGREMLLTARDSIGELSLPDILSLTPERFAEVFRRTPIKRLKLGGLLRNACVVAGNSGDRNLLPQLVALAAAHPLSFVRAHAVWAVYRLGGEVLLTEAHKGEGDAVVLAEYDAETAGR